MAAVTCIVPGLSVSGIAAARTFVPGDVIDLDAVIDTREGGQTVTWRDAIGRYVDSHFAPVPSKMSRRLRAVEPETEVAAPAAE